MRRRKKETSPERHEDELVQIVAFRLRDEHFAFRIQDVREVDKMRVVTHVPHAPGSVAGMVDVRGEVIPVIHLRHLFGLGERPPEASDRIIFVETVSSEGNGKRVLGCIVDGLSRVMRVPKPSITPAPPELTGGHLSFLEGVARVDGRLIMIVQAQTLVPTAGEQRKPPVP